MNNQEAFEIIEESVSDDELSDQAMSIIAAALDEREQLLTACEQARQFVAAWTANHESKIGARMLRKMDAAIERAKGEA